MEQYIPKAAVVAEIERRLDLLANAPVVDNEEFDAIIGAKYYELINLVQYINNLEVKEVDFKKEFDNYTKNILACDVQHEPFTHLYNCAKHFFELGIKAKKGKK